MADITWDANLPQYVLISGYAEAPPNVTLRTEMTSGKPKYRRNKTASIRPIQCQVRLSYTQKALLDTFYCTTTKGGTLAFNWVHPISRDAVEMMFAEPPTYTPSANGAHVIGALALEMLP